MSNYSVSYVDGQLSINPAPLVIQAPTGASKLGTTPRDPGLMVIGLQNNDNNKVLFGLGDTFAITANTQPGRYVINVTGMLQNSNYEISSIYSGVWQVLAPDSSRIGIFVPPGVFERSRWDSCNHKDTCCDLINAKLSIYNSYDPNLDSRNESLLKENDCPSETNLRSLLLRPIPSDC